MSEMLIYLPVAWETAQRNPEQDPTQTRTGHSGACLLFEARAAQICQRLPRARLSADLY